MAYSGGILVDTEFEASCIIRNGDDEQIQLVRRVGAV
jgi:hypothetical protein